MNLISDLAAGFTGTSPVFETQLQIASPLFEPAFRTFSASLLRLTRSGNKNKVKAAHECG
ncbi:MAG TPA: hypothetical protein DDZ90_11275 [Planctomycetaceae bacterium]|nr:hypothetical protein [Gimesia sp.]HBL43963.1 hypothetical protein [Planctomycetaceae bacterium]|tara:strand:- start:4701 stop:4880 length:180 start_codon:yes stop_codon:yes gene_type:complete